MSPARLAVVAALAAAFAVAHARAQAPPPVVPRSLEVPLGALVPGGKAADLELLATGDVIGYVDTCGCKLTPAGSLARRAWLAKEIRARFPDSPLVFLDTGNFSDNPTPEGAARTRMLLESMAGLGTKAAGVGERELVSGFDAFQEQVRGIDITFVSTNIVKDGTQTPVFPPYTIVSVPRPGGAPIRLGVLSLARFDPTWQKPGPGGSVLALAFPETMLKKYLPEVRAKSDVVVVMAGLAKDDAVALASGFKGIDLMLVAYGGVYGNVEEKVGTARMIYLGNQGKRVAENRVMLDAKGRVADVVTYMHFLTSRYPDDPEMKDAVDKLNARIAPAPTPGATSP